MLQTSDDSNAVWGSLYFAPPLRASEALDHTISALVFPKQYVDLAIAEGH